MATPYRPDRITATDPPHVRAALARMRELLDERARSEALAAAVREIEAEQRARLAAWEARG